MILDTLENAGGYETLHPNFNEAFGFLNQPGLSELADGKYEFADGNMLAIVDHAQGRRAEDAELEGHRTYIDIQYIISGDESMGWRNREGLETSVAYDDEKDLEFFKGESASVVRVPPGCFVIFYPEDAHLPLIGNGPIHKIVIKVPLN